MKNISGQLNKEQTMATKIEDAASFRIIKFLLDKNIIKDNNLYPVQFVGDGDTEKKKAYLVKKELIESKSTGISKCFVFNKMVAPS